MTDGGRRWRVRLAVAARGDLRNILRWTTDRFGEAQARRYGATLMQAIEELGTGPEVPGSRQRDEISAGLITARVAQRGRRGRHMLVYRIDVSADPPAIDVLRILHDSMDLSRHVEPEEPDSP